MFTPRNIIYGFLKTSRPPKYKYLISLYRDDDMEFLACVTTSKNRSGVPLEEVKHGANKRDNEIISYVFFVGRTIGKEYETDNDFSFPQQTTIRFDYCFQKAKQESLSNIIDDAKVVGVLSKEEYLELVYAMYRSPDTKEEYKLCLERVLQEECE